MTLNLLPTTLLVLYEAEHIEWDYIPWQPLCLAALLSLTFNFLTNFGIALFGPLIISIGMLCGIPASALIDILFRQMPLTQTFIVGSAAVMVSFVLIAFPMAKMWRKMEKMCC
uniref:Uncharacterized protein n=1 Tax=Ditylenchus dipsaci TaxID=166011 RepID=A0A915CUB0_9BILA